VIQDDVLDQVAMKESVELTCERVKNEVRGDIHALRDELKGEANVLGIDFRDRHISLPKWLCGIAIVQTASIIFGTVGLIEILK
jgi:hypothetical protein